MKRSLTVSFFVCLVYVPVANGNIDNIVNDSVQSDFGDGKDSGEASLASAYFKGTGPAPDFEQIPAAELSQINMVAYSKKFSVAMQENTGKKYSWIQNKAICTTTPKTMREKKRKPQFRDMVPIDSISIIALSLSAVDVQPGSQAVTSCTVE